MRSRADCVPDSNVRKRSRHLHLRERDGLLRRPGPCAHEALAHISIREFNQRRLVEIIQQLTVDALGWTAHIFKVVAFRENGCTTRSM